ncbi:MAG: hypothetical protein OXM61_17250 [Candidatus Poribacteria bacterium]|nr:hypothetical protein [Candidatus Poribacteria bacterium]
MNETPTNTWLKEIYDLLEELKPVLQQSIRTLEQDLKPEGDLLSNLLQTEIERQKALVERTQRGKERLQYILYEPKNQKNPIIIDPDTDEIDPDTKFIVTMPNGKKIGCKSASDTYSKILIGLGIKRVMEKVKDLNLSKNGVPLVTTDRHPKYVDNHPEHSLKRAYTPYIYEHEGETYYIFTSMPNSDKEESLLKIAELLNETLEINCP